MAQLKRDKRAVAVQELFTRYRKARTNWDAKAREDVDFYLGSHFSGKETKELENRSQSGITIDRIYPAIEQLKAILTAKPPKFSVVAREDSDSQIANVWQNMLEYIWDVSDGNEHFKQAIHDYAITGLGYFYCYIDNEADYGRGEVKFTCVNPFRVYVDPNSRSRYFDDASEIMVSTVLTRQQALNLYPQLRELKTKDDRLVIDVMSMGVEEEDYPSSQKSANANVFTPAEIKDYDYINTGKKYQLIEHFTKIKVPYYRVSLWIPKDGQMPVKPIEKIMSPEEFEKFKKDKEVQAIYKLGAADHEEILQTRVKLTCILGDLVLYEKILDTDVYPVVPVPNVWTNTPYPNGDVGKVKDVQRFINKMFSLILSHAQSSAGLKLLVPNGSVDDIEQLEKDWANPNAVIEYDASLGEPHFGTPQPLPTSFYTLMQQGEHYIDLNFGIFEMQQGNPDAAPRTSSGTLMMEEFGQRRSKSKLRDVEGSLRRLGMVVYNLAKSHFKHEKFIQVTQANNDLTEFMINQRFYDDKTGAIMKIKNDITLGQHDVRVVGSSTLPSNRYSEFELYLGAFQQGLIDRTEVLKKTNIFDKEGVLRRMSDYAKMQQVIQSQETQIKELKGDLQTARRESVSQRQRTEVEKFKTRLNEDEVRTKSERRKSLDKLKTGVTLDLEKQRLTDKYGENLDVPPEVEEFPIMEGIS